MLHIDGIPFELCSVSKFRINTLPRRGSLLIGKSRLSAVQWISRSWLWRAVVLSILGQETWKRKREKAGDYVNAGYCAVIIMWNCNLSFILWKWRTDYNEPTLKSAFHADLCYCNLPWERLMNGCYSVHVLGYSPDWTMQSVRHTIYMVSKLDKNLAKGSLTRTHCI